MFGKAKKVAEVILDENGNPVLQEKKFNWKKAAVIGGIAVGVIGAGTGIILAKNKKTDPEDNSSDEDGIDVPFVETSTTDSAE